MTEQENINKNSKPAARPPPLCVFNLKITELTEEIKKIIKNHENVRIRLTNHGTKIFVDSTDDYKKLKEQFEKSEINFFTHSLPGERTNKFVIYGLLQSTDMSFITSALAFYGLFPTDIKKLTVKKQRYNDPTTILLYFKQSDKVTLARLQQIRAIDHLIFSFRPYSRNFIGPTQCTKCLHFWPR